MKFLRLQCNQITKSFDEEHIPKKILDTISFEFHKGKTYAISGPSGSGKSTLLHILAGLEKQNSGNIQIETSDGWFGLQEVLEKARLHAYGVVFQTAHLIYQLSALENVVIKGLMAGLHSFDAHKKARELLCAMDLEPYMHHAPAMLSGGQQQRVALARALIAKPDFLFADELTSALDQQAAKHIMELLVHYQAEYGTALIIASHDPFIINSMETQLYLKDGRLIAH